MLLFTPHPYTSCLFSEGGSVEIGKIMDVDTDGSINSTQMKQLSEKMAQMEGLVTGLQDGLATATANIVVLTADNVVLKADNVALKEESAALKAVNKTFVRHTNYKHTLNTRSLLAPPFGTLSLKCTTLSLLRVCGRCGNAIF